MANYYISPDIKGALDRYVKYRIRTGDFLHAVLSNDLMEAVGRADDFNILHLKEICSYIYNEIPLACHGSPKKVREWLAGRNKV